MPSGISITRSTSAMTPTVYKSSSFGSSTDMSRWQTTPTIDFKSPLLFIRFIDLVRPIMTGMTTPGNKTMLRKGKMGTSFSSLSIPSAKPSFSSQSARMGITISIDSSAMNEGAENIFFLLFIRPIKRLVA